MARIFNRTLDLDEKAAYLMAVDDLSFEACQQACRQIYRTETFMPVPAVLRSYAVEWQQRQKPLVQQAPSPQKQLQLREELVPLEEIRELLRPFLGDDSLKDPIPPYEQEDAP